MKLQEDKWYQAIRKRMEGYEEPVADKVWDSIERELSGSSRKPNFIFRKMAVAASVLIAILSSISLYFLFSPLEKYMEGSTELVELVKEYNEILEEEIMVTEPSFPELTTRLNENDIIHKSNKELDHVEKEKSKVSLPLQEELYPDEEMEEATEETDFPVEITTDKKDSDKSSSQNRFDNDFSSNRDNNFMSFAGRNKSKNNKWGINISAGNTFMSELNTNNGGYGVLYEPTPYKSSVGGENEIGGEVMEPTSDGRRKVMMKNQDQQQQPETEVKHKMPVTFGASFRYEITEKFAIESGLIYTMLSSELEAGTTDNYYIENYKLHYLGIPIKGNWTFFRKEIFTLYLSAGGAFEKSVSGKYRQKSFEENKLIEEENKNLNVKPLQWSVNGALGAQINFSKHLGLYVEPGVVHYFDDGSSVETIRKSKPTNFNLNIGFRFVY